MDTHIIMKYSKWLMFIAYLINEQVQKYINSLSNIYVHDDYLPEYYLF